MAFERSIAGAAVLASSDRFGDTSIVPLAEAGRLVPPESTRQSELNRSLAFEWTHSPCALPLDAEAVTTRRLLPDGKENAPYLASPGEALGQNAAGR